MIKKLSAADVASALKDSDFQINGNRTQKYFFLQNEALKQAKVCLDNPKIYANFILTGMSGSGKKNSILKLIRDKFNEPANVIQYYFHSLTNTISTSPESSNQKSFSLFPKPEGLPLIYEANPSISNLAGIPGEENYIPGALISSTGGFLVMPILPFINDVNLFNFFINCLEKKRIDFSSLPELSFYNTFNRNFPNIPLQTRVILLGEEEHYDQLLKRNVNLQNIFKIRIELAYDAYISSQTLAEFSELIDTWQINNYPPASPSAKRKLMEYCLSGYDSKRRFPLNLSEIKAVSEEAQVIFKDKKILTDIEIDFAVESLVARNSSGKIRYYDEIKDGFIKLQLSGDRVGRINALSIITFFNPLIDFGQLSVVSARVSIGNGNFINIEREVNLSGDIYDRAIFTLSSYIKGLFQTFDVDVAIMFEQNNTLIDGDSASAAELMAVLSALARQPIKANIAITGSVSQYGDILPVGAINKKIETWHEIISNFGDEKEIYEMFIPSANASDIILPTKMIESISTGRFILKSYSNINDIIPEIFGISPGVIGEDNRYSVNTLLGKIEQSLEQKKAEIHNKD